MSLGLGRISTVRSVLRGARIGTNRCRSLDWDSSADDLYAKIAEVLHVLHLGGAANRERAMKGSFDEQYRPGLETFGSEPFHQVQALEAGSCCQ